MQRKLQDWAIFEKLDSTREPWGLVLISLRKGLRVLQRKSWYPSTSCKVLQKLLWLWCWPWKNSDWFITPLFSPVPNFSSSFKKGQASETRCCAKVTVTVQCFHVPMEILFASVHPLAPRVQALYSATFSWLPTSCHVPGLFWGLEAMTRNTFLHFKLQLITTEG